MSKYSDMHGNTSPLNFLLSSLQRISRPGDETVCRGTQFPEAQKFIAIVI